MQACATKLLAVKARTVDKDCDNAEAQRAAESIREQASGQRVDTLYGEGAAVAAARITIRPQYDPMVAPADAVARMITESCSINAPKQAIATMTTMAICAANAERDQSGDCAAEDRTISGPPTK